MVLNLFFESKQVAVIQNGEIYNYIEVKNTLIKEGIVHSDTEVILKAYEFYGIDFIHRLNGMFVICILDKRHEKCTYLEIGWV